jgi:hypothetical protein
MEHTPEPRELVALLAEPDRLKALAAVALGANRLPDVAEYAGLEAKTAAKALSRLVAGGLVEGGSGEGYRVRAETLQAAARRPADEAEPEEDKDGSPEAAVLRRFLHRGRLLSVPAARGKRLLVLNHLAGLFEPGRRYPEHEVNELLGRVNPDYAMLRRYLVDDGFLDRADEPAPSGSRSVKVYWRTGGTVELD